MILLLEPLLMLNVFQEIPKQAKGTVDCRVFACALHLEPVELGLWTSRHGAEETPNVGRITE